MSVDMSKHFSTSALIKFTLPTIAMMIFTSCYTIVDGFSCPTSRARRPLPP